MQTSSVARSAILLWSVLQLAGCASAPRSGPLAPDKTPDKTAPSADPMAVFGGLTGCFTMRELGSGETFEMGGNECGERSIPASTFKITNALIALDTGVLKDETTILKWDGVTRSNPAWSRDHTLPTSMWYSVVWFYQVIARDVGADRYRTYLSAFDYGNADPSGEVTMFWLDGPLRISPREQIKFLAALYEGRLKVSTRAMDTVKKTLELRGEAKEHVRGRLPFVDRVPERTVLSGKTGSAVPDGPIGPLDVVGWFVGAVQRDGRTWVYACRIRSNDEKKIGPEAARIAFEVLESRKML